MNCGFMGYDAVLVDGENSKAHIVNLQEEGIVQSSTVRSPLYRGRPNHMPEHTAYDHRPEDHHRENLRSHRNKYCLRFKIFCRENMTISYEVT
jgi:predicted ArsR family transcriptional regulator